MNINLLQSYSLLKLDARDVDNDLALGDDLAFDDDLALGDDLAFNSYNGGNNWLQTVNFSTTNFLSLRRYWQKHY